MGSFFTDCKKFYHEARNQSVSSQQQLDKANSKLLAQFEVQNAEIIKLKDDLATSKFKVEFYQQEAEKA